MVGSTGTAPGAWERDRSQRVFFAIVPDATARRALAALANEVQRSAGGRAARQENLHLTLAFIGNIAPECVEGLASIGADAAQACAPFPLCIDRVGSFREARVAWAGMEAAPDELQCLFDRLRFSLGAAGLPTERRAFHPHVTLARRCTRALPGAATGSVAWHVDSIVLMASEAAPGGARYRVLAQWPLAGAAALP